MTSILLWTSVSEIDYQTHEATESWSNQKDDYVRIPLNTGLISRIINKEKNNRKMKNKANPPPSPPHHDMSEKAAKTFGFDSICRGIKGLVGSVIATAVVNICFGFCFWNSTRGLTGDDGNGLRSYCFISKNYDWYQQQRGQRQQRNWYSWNDEYWEEITSAGIWRIKYEPPEMLSSQFATCLHGTASVAW